MCVGIPMCTNTQMFTFCTYPVDFNSSELLMNDLLAFKYQPIKIQHMRNGVFFITPSNRYIHQLPMLWISTHLNSLWMIYRRFSFSQSNSSARACACGLAFFGISIYRCYIIYLCCEYQLIWTYNELFIGVFVLTNQIQAHVHARAGMLFFSVSIYRCSYNLPMLWISTHLLL
jgi:hypothetical protein